MTLIERLKTIVTHKGISKRKFYSLTGLSNGYLDKEREVGHKKIEKIHSLFPEINLKWLLTGQGDMIKKDDSLRTDDSVKIDDNHINKTTLEIIENEELYLKNKNFSNWVKLKLADHEIKIHEKYAERDNRSKKIFRK